MSKQWTQSRILASTMVGVALAASACGGGDSKEDAAPAGAEGGQTVSMKLIAFKPERLTVSPGTSVTWKNDDASEHTVTSGVVNQGSGSVTTATDGKFQSASLKQNATFSHTFTAPGTYAYFCTIHPATMRGEITVK